MGCNTALPYICEAKMTYVEPSPDADDPRGTLQNCTGYHEHAFGEYCYRMHNYTVSWYDAEHRCVGDGGHVITLHSGTENEVVKNWASSYIDPNEHGQWYVWLGLKRNKMFGFEWVDSSPLDYSHWAVGAPDTDSKSVLCGEMFSNGYWHDDDCTKKKTFGCKTQRMHEVSTSIYINRP